MNFKNTVNMKEVKKVFEFDYEEVKNKALAQLKTGKPLLGKGGALGPLFKSFLEAALEAELEDHFQENKDEQLNRRNGHGTKILRTSEGSMELTTPRDRIGSFEPEIVKKRQTILADSLEDKILGLYGLGMSLRDISAHIREMYDSDISHTVLSEITDRIIPLHSFMAEPAIRRYLYDCMVGCDVLQGKRRQWSCSNAVFIQCIRN